MPSVSARLVATVQAVAVCFVWSTSFLVTKRLYEYGVGPLTLTGLRFGLAAATLAPLWWYRRRVRSRWGAGGRLRLCVVIPLGIAGYAVNPIGYHIALAMSDASWVSVLLAVGNTLQVLAWSAVILREWPTWVQLIATVTAMVGIVVFESPAGGVESTAVVSIGSVFVGGVGYALWVVGGRVLMREADPVALALACMLAGAVPSLMAGLLIEGLPRLPLDAWALIAPLAVVNTASTFVVWNHTQRVLPAYESAIINNTMTVQVALLAFAFLGDPLGVRQWVAIGIVTGAVIVVQLAKPGSSRRTDTGSMPHDQ